LKVVPGVALLKLTAVVPPEQIVCVVGLAEPTGPGFTVIVTVIGAPGHPPAVGVIVYTAVPAEEPVAFRV
jgi:hypothetical protein